METPLFPTSLRKMQAALLVAHLVHLAQSFGDHYSIQPRPGYEAKVYAGYLAECGPGEYLNLCGECVSGKSEKDDGFGKDSCGVCGGLETCKEQCSDPLGALAEDEDEKGCQMLIAMSPTMMDLAESSVGSVCVFGSGVSPRTVKEVHCTLREEEEDVSLIETEVLEGKIQLTFPLPTREGSYDLHCNTSVGTELQQRVMIVDSRSLVPTAVDKPSLTTWAENQMTVTVSKMTGPADLLCFARTLSKDLVFAVWTELVAGNSLSSTVHCPPFVPVRPEPLEYGVAYSVTGARTAKAVRVDGVAEAPQHLTAMFRPHVPEVVVTFDQNLQGDLKGCSTLFDHPTLLLLGTAPSCYITANEVHIKLRGVAMKNNTVLSFREQAVKTKFSKAGWGGQVLVVVEDVPNEVKLEGRRRLCSGEEAQLEISSNTQTVSPPVWKVAGPNRTDIPVGQLRRLNLMAWKAARASRNNAKALTINSKMMTPGQKYTVRAAANDSTGAQREVWTEVFLSSPGEAWLQLEGPSSVDVQEYAFFQATLRSCGPPIAPSMYKWKLASDVDAVDTYFFQGPKLALTPGSLQPDNTYRLEVRAYGSDEPLASESVVVKTYLRNFEIRLKDAKIVVGNGHSLEIDASRSVDMNSDVIKLKWSCKRGYCYLPGKDKKPLGSLEAFSRPVLSLPAKTLAVGRYIFALEATNRGTKMAEEEVEVLVVRGQPPYISALTVTEGMTSFVLQVDVLEVLQRCELSWKVVPRVGYSYIVVPENVTTVEGSPTRPLSTQMKLSIDKDSLIAGSRSMLRASVDCDRVAQSYREFRFFVPEVMDGARLEVEPIKGTAMETEFVFRLVERGAAMRRLYTFGYLGDGRLSAFDSGHAKELKTYLGCCSFQTVARVCRSWNDCVTVYGPQVRTTLPSSLNASVTRWFADSYKEQLLSTRYEEALTNLKMVLPVLKEAEPGAYEQFVQDVQEVLVGRMRVYMGRLEKDKDCLEESLKMLDAAGGVMATMPLSEDSMAAVLRFRDLVHASARSKSEKMNEKKISEKLPPEPRPNLDNGVSVRRRRSTDTDHISIIAAETSLRSAIQLLRRLEDDSEAGRRERAMFLDSIFLSAGLGPQGDNTIQKGEQAIANFMPRIIKENVERRKRGVEDPKKSIIDTMESVLRVTAQSLQTIANESERHRQKYTLIKYLDEYSRDLCNQFSTRRSIGTEQDLVRLGVEPLKSGLKGRVSPLCYSRCTNGTALVNVSLAGHEPPTDESICVAIGWMRDDILTNSSQTVTPVGVRWGGVHWIKVMTYEDDVVPKDPYNVTFPNLAGNAVLQFPAWPDPAGKKMECWMFGPSGWNTTGCVKTKEMSKGNVTYVQCRCSIPGFYSLFAVDEVKPGEKNGTVTKTTSNNIPVTSPAAAPDPVTTTSNPAPVKTASTSVPASAAIPVTTAPTTFSTAAVTPTTSVTKAPIITTVPANITTVRVTSTSTVSSRGTNSTDSHKTLSTVEPANSTVTQPSDDVRTVPSIFQPYKYSATFSINESYAEEVGEMKEKFEEHIEDQLQEIFNMSDSITVDAHEHKDMIAVTLRIPEKKLQETGTSIVGLKDQLKNGSLFLTSIGGSRLQVPAQDIVLTQQGGAAKSAITAFVTIVFIFLIILIGSVLAAFYLRNSREMRTIRMTQDLQSDPPAPKYLRLHDSVSLDSSGPSTPQNNEMESSLSVLTKPQRRGYETMETFSNFPGNI